MSAWADEERMGPGGATDLAVDWDDAVLLALAPRRGVGGGFEAELEAAPARDERPGLLKDDPDLRAAALEPVQPIDVAPAASAQTQKLAETYNRLGGLFGAVADALGVDVATVGALWFVESGGRVHTPGRLRVRLDVERLWQGWGRHQAARFAQYFRRGTSTHEEQLRDDPRGPFRPLGHDPAAQRAAMRLAMRIAGNDAGLRALRVGEPELPLSAHRALGYASPTEMRDALDADERNQVLGLFDRLGTLRALPDDGSVPLVELARTRDFTAIAARLHGTGEAASLANQLERARRKLAQLLEPAAARSEPEPRATASPDPWPGHWWPRPGHGHHPPRPGHGRPPGAGHGHHPPHAGPGHGHHPPRPGHGHHPPRPGHGHHPPHAGPGHGHHPPHAGPGRLPPHAGPGRSPPHRPPGRPAPRGRLFAPAHTLPAPRGGRAIGRSPSKHPVHRREV